MTQRKNHKILYITAIVTILTLILVTVALADDVHNDLVAGTTSITLTAGDSSGVDVQFYVQPTGGDDDPQCNFDITSEHLTFTINTPSGVTADPSSLTFNKCHDGSNFNYQTVNFSASASADSGNISFTETFNNSGGTFKYDQAVFNINVISVNTPPSVSVTGVSNGASYEFGSVPAGGCSVVDAEDGDSTFPAELSAITGPLSDYGLGDQTASCSYTDGGGLSDSDSATYTIVDTTDPVITFVSRTPANSYGWNNGDVVVTWSCTDNVGVVSATVTKTISAEGAGQSATGTCTDLVGRTASNTQTGINIDLTDPTISASISPDRPVIGWWNIASGAPTVSFTCDDELSGLAVDACPADFTFDEGEGLFYSASVYDLAGNSASAGVTDIDVDLTAPSISASITPDAALSGWWNISTGAPTVTYTCEDDTSGVASCTDPYTFGEGADQTHTGYAADNAGNTNSEIVSDIDVDLTAPTLTWNGGPADGGIYYFGFVPAAPTCTASDDLSGPDGCEVTGYSTAIGTHTMTATALDVAGNSYSEQRTYEVKHWTLNGFFPPVDMGYVFNVVKNGSTVPLKFEIFAGPTELTDVGYVGPFMYAQTSCDATAITDPIETTSTGGTSLRYDPVAGQFVYNWKTPKIPGACYLVTVTTLDGSSLTAYFKLK
jgi:hypothetical protein